jgi:hypothetical protein
MKNFEILAKFHALKPLEYEKLLFFLGLSSMCVHMNVYFNST